MAAEPLVLQRHDGRRAGSLSHLRLTLSFPACTAVIDGTSGTAGDGTVGFRYFNRTGVLHLGATPGNLRFYNMRGCAGLINTGDSATISASYTVTPGRRSPGRDARGPGGRPRPIAAGPAGAAVVGAAGTKAQAPGAGRQAGAPGEA